jgi:hypothetical protein
MLGKQGIFPNVIFLVEYGKFFSLALKSESGTSLSFLFFVTIVVQIFCVHITRKTRIKRHGLEKKLFDTFTSSKISSIFLSSLVYEN